MRAIESGYSVEKVQTNSVVKDKQKIQNDCETDYHVLVEILGTFMDTECSPKPYLMLDDVKIIL